MANKAPQEHYSHGYLSETLQRQTRRTASSHAAFFLPYLRPGIALLDCGCGPGSITADLARAVAPGDVVGIDVESRVIERAKSRATEEGVSNVRFQVASVHELPFADDAFDAVFVHAVLEHLAEPLRALAEMRRVLKPGGVIGARDADFGHLLLSPMDAAMGEFLKIYLKDMRASGGDPFMARRLRALLGEAGFVRVEASSSTSHWGTPEAVRRWSAEFARRVLDPDFADRVISRGFADRTTLDEINVAIRKWGENPHAFGTLLYCEAIGWKDIS